MNKILNGIIGKIVVLILAGLITVFSGLTTFFIYKSVNTTEKMTDLYFDIRKGQIEDQASNEESHEMIMDTITYLADKINPNSDSIHSNTDTLKVLRIDVNKNTKTLKKHGLF